MSTMRLIVGCGSPPAAASGRHGGPSVDAAKGLRTIPEIQKRGMWRAASSVRRYEKAGTLMRQLEKVPRALLTSFPSKPVQLKSRACFRIACY